MARGDAGESDTPPREIRLIEEDDGWWSAVEEETGVASQGATHQEALESLKQAIPSNRL
jgi:predicted RNase H-like HicB family nuclease